MEGINTARAHNPAIAGTVAVYIAATAAIDHVRGGAFPAAPESALSLAREAVIRNGSFDFRRRYGYFPRCEKQSAADKDNQSANNDDGCQFFHSGATLSRFVIRRQSQSPKTGPSG